MKQTTLEDLYYGNINPNEISFVRGSEYGKCFDKVAELSKSVCSQLSEKYINKMNEILSVYMLTVDFLHSVWYNNLKFYVTKNQE